MRIDIKKTKVLKISKRKETIVRINIGAKEIEQVKDFCYLVSMITTDAKCHREIKRRIAIGKETFFLEKESTSERKSKQIIEHMDDKDTDMECGAVWFRSMDHEERGYKKT